MDDALQYLVNRLEHDIVFQSECLKHDDAVERANRIIGSFSMPSLAIKRFPLSDWTFSEVLSVIDSQTSLLLAFIGED